jgi:hypothetical protein
MADGCLGDLELPGSGCWDGYLAVSWVYPDCETGIIDNLCNTSRVCCSSAESSSAVMLFVNRHFVDVMLCNESTIRGAMTVSNCSNVERVTPCSSRGGRRSHCRTITES